MLNKLLNKLPVDDYIPKILKTLHEESNIVIVAAPGAGKTTRIPAAVAMNSKGKVLVLEPRRVAAQAACQRIASEQNWKVGEEIGYQVRFENKSSEKTQLIFMTEALLSRHSLSNPELHGIDCIILDEFHERSIHTDIALGLIRELQELGSSIKLIVMSATLNAEKISKYLGHAQIFDIPGQLFDLDIQYQKKSQMLSLSYMFYKNLILTVKAAQAKTSHDILVFLPGVGEIRRAQELLLEWGNKVQVLIIPLHGQLSLEEQKQAIQKQSQQKIILSTNIAESSITIDGVDTVIDSGLSKTVKLNNQTGFSDLTLGRISRSSAQQRAGRSARQFPGKCYRLWNKQDEISMPDHDISEVLRADLTDHLLFLAAFGVTQFNHFSWYEKPFQKSIEQAQNSLLKMNAIDKHHRMSSIGKEMMTLPLPARLARLIIEGKKLNLLGLACDVAAILQEKDFLNPTNQDTFQNEECDLKIRIDILQDFRSEFKNNVNRHLLNRVIQVSEQLKKYSKAPQTPIKTDMITELLLSTFSDRLCKRRPHSDKGVMINGRGVALSAKSSVKKSDFFIALSGMETQGADTQILWASGLSKNFVKNYFKDHIIARQHLEYEENKKQFYAKEFRMLEHLKIEEGPIRIANADEVSELLPEFLWSRWGDVLKNNTELAGFILRLEYLYQCRDKHSLGSINNFFEGDSLRKDYIIESFKLACVGESQIDTIINKNLIYFFESALPMEILNFLNKELPDKIKVPSGSLIKIQYQKDKNPLIEVRIQEIFSWEKTPVFLENKIPLTIHLLGPNYRPVQITNDLESFWRNGYPEVRKELRLRYPKHQWPEDPFLGVAEAKGRARTHR